MERSRAGQTQTGVGSRAGDDFMRGSPRRMQRPDKFPFPTLVSLLVLFRSSAGVLFQRFKTGDHNFCVAPLPINEIPVKVWPQMYSINSTAITREMKECSVFCLQDPECMFFQVVRIDRGIGFCHTFRRISAVEVIEDEGICKGLFKREKKLDCIIRWNPENYKTRYNAVGFRIERLDQSWTVGDNSTGIHIVELNAVNCSPAGHRVFNTATGAGEQSKLKTHLDRTIPRGSYLVGYSVGDFFKADVAFLSDYFEISYGKGDSHSLAFACLKGDRLECHSQLRWSAFGYTLFLGATKNNPFASLVGNPNAMTIYYNVLLGY